MVTEASCTLNGLVSSKSWKAIDQAGDVLTFGIAPGEYTPNDFFFYVFHQMHLAVIAGLTNVRQEDHSE